MRLFSKQLPVPASVTSPTDPFLLWPTLATLFRLSDPMLVLASDPSILSLGAPEEKQKVKNCGQSLQIARDKFMVSFITLTQSAC
jgi:hypothetical protein